MKPSILITGSQGYIGKALVSKLTSRNYDVIEFDISIGLDINTETDLNRYLNDVDIVVNLAALGDLYDVMEDPDKGYKVNVIGAEKIGKACLEKNIELIHVSTCCVYGNQNCSIITEETYPQPTDIYAIQKLQSEICLMKMIDLGLRLSIARLGTVYGGFMRPSQVMHRFIAQNLRGEPIVIHGDGNQERVYTYIDDAVNGLIQLIDNEKHHVIYNICSEKSYSVKEIAENIEKITGSPFETIFIEDRPGQIYYQTIKAERMVNDFLWFATTSLQEGLLDSIVLIKNKIEKEVYNKKIIPCVHRIHEHSCSKLDDAHLLQKRLGFSLSDKILKEKLLKLVKKNEKSEKILVTFDDGYKDVLIMEQFFDNNCNFQPVIFYPTSLFENKPSWFDIFYSNIAKMETKEINEILQKRGYNINNIQKMIDAINILKEDIRNQLPIDQENNLIDLFGKNINKNLNNIYLKRKDLRRLIKKGWVVGSHSKYHYNLTKEKSETLEMELSDSLHSILDIGGRAWLAYPDGRWNPKLKKIAQFVGFKALFALDKTSYSDNDADHLYRTLL